MYETPNLTVLITPQPRRAPFERVDIPAWLTESMFVVSTATREIVRECPFSCYSSPTGFRVTERSMIGFQSDSCGCILIADSPSGNVNWPMCWV